MSFRRLSFRPGINTEVSQTANEGGWSASGQVRFRNGVPQKIGGWQSQSSTALTGVPRAMVSWQDLSGNLYAAIGTNAALSIWSSGQFYTITPAGIPVGLADAFDGVTWGGGYWGGGTWGFGAIYLSQPPANSQTAWMRLWSLGTWGQNLVATYSNGSLYQWAPVTPPSGLATIVTNASTPANGPPLCNRLLLVAMPERHLILFGCSDLNASTNLDPMLIRFSDVEDYTSWMATAFNSAGSFRLQDGTAIIGAVASTQQMLVWTDTALHSMRFIGAPYYYSFNKIASQCGLIGQNAAADYSGTTYWMGRAAFYTYAGGSVQQLPCPLYHYVFNNFNQKESGKVCCALNVPANEVTWYYPSAGNIENDSYVTLNYAEGLWYAGTMARTAWEPAKAFPTILACSPSGILYAQETGVDADGAAIDAYLESGWLDIADGDQFVTVNRIIPDFGGDMSGTVQLSLKTTDTPGGAPRVAGPFVITPTTGVMTVRVRGRQLAIRLESNAVGDFWRLGAFRVNMVPDGKR